MYNALAYQAQKTIIDERVRQASLPKPARRPAKGPRRRAALAGILAAVALAAVPSLARAQSLNSVAISSDASYNTMALDVAGASTSVGAPVIQWYFNGGSNQRWNFVQLPDGNEHIVNQNSGMCLTTDGIAGDQVTQWTCNGSSQEEWHGSLPGGISSFSTLKNPASGLYLDVSGDSPWAGGHIIVWYWNSTHGELFSYLQY